MFSVADVFRGVHNAANQPPKKRKYSDSPPGTLTPGLLMNTLGVGNILPIKPEPCPPDLRYGTSTKRPVTLVLSRKEQRQQLNRSRMEYQDRFRTELERYIIIIEIEQYQNFNISRIELSTIWRRIGMEIQDKQNENRL